MKNSLLQGLALIVAASTGQALAADFCDFAVNQAPAVLGSAVTMQRHVNGEICLINAIDKKSWLTARIQPAPQAARLVADVRKQYESLKISTLDEPALSSGAWRTSGQISVVFCFASGDRFMLVEMWRDGRPTNVDVANVREFAKAFGKQ